MFGSLASGWQFIVSAVKSGVESVVSIARTVSDALNLDYQQTLQVTDEAIEAVSTWQKLGELPDFYEVSARFGKPTSFDYNEKYIMQMHVHGINPKNNEKIDMWITVENDKPLTKEEWFLTAQDAVFESPLGYTYTLDYATEFNYYVRE